MTQIDCYALSAKAARALTKEPFGKLTPVVTTEEGSRPFRLLDTFDGEVAASGRLLFSAGGDLELMTDEAGPLRQSKAKGARFVTDLPDGAVKLALSSVSPLRALLPVGGGAMEEIAVVFLDGERKTRVRARMLSLQSDAGGALVLVVLQSLRGYSKALEQVRKQIADLGGAQISEGAVYTMLFPDRLAYQAKPEIKITGDEAAYDAANDIIRTYLPIATANEAGIVADHDIEFLHDYRIALRKIRSVLSLFAGVYSDSMTLRLKTRFSDLMAPTGQLRDLDVYLAEKAKFYDLLPASLHPGLDQLFAMFDAQRAAAQKQLSVRLTSKAYKREFGELTDLFAGSKKLRRGPNAGRPALGYSSALIWKRYRKVCKIAAGIDDQTEDEEVHRLRIQCKKLRYLMEFFAPVFPRKRFRSILKPLKALQDNLGLFNDYSVQQDSLRALLEELDGKPDPRNLLIAQSVGALIVVLHKKQLEERARVVESFAKFNDKTTRETFRSLFHSRKETT